jgi:UDP-N-acetylmuramoyl-L-alanyl-D-glutamate-L-lysine ligase
LIERGEMMRVSEVITIIKKDHNFCEIIDSFGDWHYTFPENLAQIKINDLSYDSRKISRDTLFFVKGLNFKIEYLEAAVEAGLVFFVAEKILSDVGNAVWIIVKDVGRALALVSQKFFGNPQDKLKIVAFTGTKGKTTSAYFVKGMLDEKAALFSSIESTVDGKNYFKSELTTPESLDFYGMI